MPSGWKLRNERAHVARYHGADRLDAVVCAGGVHRVAPAGADAEHADAGRVDAGEVAQRVDRVGDVLAAPVRVLQVTGLTAALALVGGVEHERRDAPGGQAYGVVRADLFLDAAAWC